MADFNKISVNSSLTVTQANFASLCFNDNLLISKSKYSIENNLLNLLIPTNETVSIFSNHGIANVYEFDDVRLNIPGVFLPTIDINGNQVENLVQNQVLIFVDGKLQPASAYTILDSTTIKFNINYTNDYNTLFKVIVYTSNVPFQRLTYTQEQFLQANQQTDLNQNIITLPLTYENKNTALFINEHKIPFNAITCLNTSNTELILNIPEKLKEDINSFEVIKFVDNATYSINFTTTHGYTTYGPYDDLGKKLPNTYDVIFKFTDQVKLLIDNIRPGFIIKEADGYGEAIIVDTNFETMEVKGLIIQPFVYSNYTNKQYYIEVPETTSIIKYLSTYDKQFTFLPEILEIFQRLLLDELQDTIQRLREIRSISKVDSVHINKLISLLGFDINIKQLNKKQRRELLEELTEFYRTAGTRDSYNLINILQNNLKLISADQLFTPSGLSKRKNQTLYDYSISVAEGKAGTGYSVYDVLELKTEENESSGLIGKVMEVDENGGITKIELETPEGYKDFNQSFTVQSILNGTFKVNSTPCLYSYDWTVKNPTNCLIGMKLYNTERTYGIEITDIQGDEIIYNRLKPDHKYNVNQDIYNINFNGLRLYQLVDDLKAKIISTPNITSVSDYGDPIYDSNTDKDYIPGQELQVTLDPGTYYIEIAGAGGAGGAGDSRHGNSHDLFATDGANGELKNISITLDKITTLIGKVGQGGGAVKARGHDHQPANKVLGNGFNNGTLGELYHLKHYGNIAGGQGGGSSGLINADGETIIEARGGNGGYASENVFFKKTVKGGIGGGGGVTSGDGGRGGGRAWGGDFWSKPGSDGWIKIYSVPLTYSVTLEGDFSNIGDGESFQTVETTPTYTIVVHKDGDTITTDLEPTTGNYGCNGTFNLEKTLDNASIDLSIASTAIKWNYDVKLSTDTTHVLAGTEFINLKSPIDEQFIFTIAQDHSNKGTWTPTQGTSKIVLNNVPAYTQQGSGAEVIVVSTTNTQKNEDRCYIDFYKKEELFDKDKGEGYYSEFKSDAIEYGTITEGTPNSPKFWEVGTPDISYGTITEGTPNSPNPTKVDTPDIAYGEVSWSTEGEWVEYWIWNRGTNWYPTNHVDLEMKLPPGVNFSEYINTFIEQFYNLASTVLFIHQITESFYFGNEATSNYNTTVTTSSGLTGDSGTMIAPFGIVSTMPLIEYEEIVTSDPTRQYIDPINQVYSVTILPRIEHPENAHVIITYKALVDGVVEDKVVADGLGPQTIQVNHGIEVRYTVSATGYETRTDNFIAKDNTTKYVILNAINAPEPKACVFKINPTPEKANVVFTINNITSANTNIVYVWSGTTVGYSVSYQGYATQTGEVVINNNTELTITLIPEN